MTGDDSHFFTHLNFPSLQARHRPVRDHWDYTGKGKWNDILQSNRANQEESLLSCFIPFPNNLNEGNLPNWFAKIKRQISVGPVWVVKVNHLKGGP